MAADLFNEGNALFVDENYTRALEKYTAAVDQDDTNCEYLLKRSACYSKLERFVDALVDANAAIQQNNTLANAYFRQGVAYVGLKDYQQANGAFLRAKELGDATPATDDWLAKCKQHLGAAFQAHLSGPAVQAQANTAPQPLLVPVAAAAAVTSPNTELRIKHDWFQTDKSVTVAIMLKGASASDVTVEQTDKTLSVSVRRASSAEYNLDLDLWAPVVPNQYALSVLKTKIEIKLTKTSPVRWLHLEGDGAPDVPSMIMKEPDAVVMEKEKKRTQKWDTLASEVQKEEANQKLDGDAALNKLFQDIYKDASEETRRAMNKSFQESGGTVLSTNWAEIGAKKVDVQPPAGTEYKKWEK